MVVGANAEAVYPREHNAGRPIANHYLIGDIHPETAYNAGAPIAVEITIEERRQIRIVNDIAADDRTGSTRLFNAVRIGQDRGFRRIGAGTGRVERDVAFVFRPAEIRARDIRRAQVIDFLAPLLADIAEDEVAAIEREAPGLAQAIGIDFVAAMLADIRIGSRNVIGFSPGGQRFDPQDLAE